MESLTRAKKLYNVQSSKAKDHYEEYFNKTSSTVSTEYTHLLDSVIFGFWSSLKFFTAYRMNLLETLLKKLDKISSTNFPCTTEIMS